MGRISSNGVDSVLIIGHSSGKAIFDMVNQNLLDENFVQGVLTLTPQTMELI